MRNPAPAPLGCVVMASGLGRRFGGNKLLAELGGKPLLCWVLDVTEGLFARRVVVTRHPEVAELCRRRGAEVLLHTLPQRSDTVRLGLEYLGPDWEGYAFFPGDQPLLRRETAEALVQAMTEEPDFIWRPACGGEPGAPVLFPRWAYEELAALPEGQGGRIVVRRHPDRVRFLPAQGFELLDADTPEGLQALARQLEAGESAQAGRKPCC